MKNYIKYGLLTMSISFACLGVMSKAQAQTQATDCIMGCNDNTFIWSDEPNTIEYDNMISGFHSTILREADGTVKVWGQGASPTSGDLTSPRIVSSTNGYNYQGEILKFTLASIGNLNSDDQQFALLTTEGLYVWGGTNRLVNSTVKSNMTFGKVSTTTSGTNSFGLPTSVNPTNVKMMFGSYQTLGIVTCDGAAWMLSAMGGKNGRGSNSDGGATWTQVQTSGNTNLTNVVAMRGTYNAMVALTRDGELYTWGTGTYLGDSQGASNNRYATKMTLPTGVRPKMIGMTYNRTTNGNNSQGNSYYLLSTTGELYALGNNGLSQLGDFSTTTRTSWVRVKSGSGNNDLLTDIVWFSPNEHDYAGHAAVSALTTGGKLWSWGSNNGQMIGGGSGNGNSTKNPMLMGRGLANTDQLIAVETGGHTTMVIRECSMRYGYIGHKVNGSMGDGVTSSSNVSNFNFSDTANVNLCGAPTAPAIKGLLKICEGNTANLDNARIALDDTLEWFTNAEGSIPVQNPLSVGPGTYYAAHAGNNCEVIPTSKVVVEYLTAGEPGFEDCTLADLYTEIEYTINGVANATSGSVGDTVVYTVTAGNYGPKNAAGAPFTFTVPVGVEVTNLNITPDIHCVDASSTAGESIAITYDVSTRTFRSKLNLPDGCTVTYTITATLNGLMGSKTAESTILRPVGVYDPDATNKEDTEPTNPHYECYNDGDSGNTISCNNIQEKTFILLGADCVDALLYFEDFGRTTWAVNSGRSSWKAEASWGISGTSFTNVRDGQQGGATSSYLFAPGVGDSRYSQANIGHSATVSVARIKNGFYSVNPPGYVQMGIPTTDLWNVGTWVPNAPTNDPNLANSNYDWTPAWTLSTSIRDVSGAVNGAAFLVRGSSSTTQSIRPFYEFNVPGQIVVNTKYTLSLYSYVTYHDKDYMLMDVVDQTSGFIYASVPLKYPGPGLPPNASPEGFSLGWVPLEASFIFDESNCADIAGKNVRIAIRGSQDRALETGKGFGHTLLDDINFTKRTVAANCTIPATEVACEGDCYEDVEGEGFGWRHDEGEAPSNPVVQEFVQPGTNGGFVLDIYKLDNSFNMNINGVPLHTEELEFQSGTSSNLVQNVRFKSDGKKWGETGVSTIWTLNNHVQDADIDQIDRRNNPTPAIRVQIDRWGNVNLLGKRNTTDVLEELEVFNKSTGTVVVLDPIGWNQDVNNATANTIEMTQKVTGATAAYGFGYGQNIKECETCTIEKDGFFNDNNNNGFAHEGETITYTFDVRNLGDMDIYSLEIADPLFGFTIRLDENTNLPIQQGVTLTGDNNEDGILNWNETWTFTVDYQITNNDIFTNKGVYNRAEVKGMGKLFNSPEGQAPNVAIQDIWSTDPTPYTEDDEGWDEARPYHTYVQLKGSGLLITNPMIYQRTK